MKKLQKSILLGGNALTCSVVFKIGVKVKKTLSYTLLAACVVSLFLSHANAGQDQEKTQVSCNLNPVLSLPIPATGQTVTANVIKMTQSNSGKLMFVAATYTPFSLTLDVLGEIGPVEQERLTSGHGAFSVLNQYVGPHAGVADISLVSHIDSYYSHHPDLMELTLILFKDAQDEVLGMAITYEDYVSDAPTAISGCQR